MQVISGITASSSCKYLTRRADLCAYVENFFASFGTKKPLFAFTTGIELRLAEGGR